jgi:transglutaminase-like putative cysteine protease
MNPRTQLAVAAASVTLLSATALHAAFVDTAWVAPVVGVVLSVLAGAEIGSRLGQHLVARPVWRFLGSALAALFFITAVYAHEGAIFGFIPRGHTWHLLRALTHKGFTEIHDLPTPAPTYRALMLITVTGVALVAIAVDQLSVKAPLIGLPLLALYSVPEWLAKSGTGWIPLALGGSGYIGLLIREGRDRTSRWGRTVTGASPLGRDRSPSAAMSQAGWRIGAVALAVALVVPPLIPDLGHFNLAKGGGVASNATVHYDPVAQLNGDLQQGVTIHQYTYESSDSEGHYLRLATLDQFTAPRFFSSPLAADPGVDATADTLGLDEISAAVSSTPLTTNVAIGKQLGNKTLPIPEETTKLVGLQGTWWYQQSSASVFSPSNNGTTNQRFTATSEILSPLPADLQKSALITSKASDYDSVSAELTVPSGLPTLVKAKALAITKGDTTPYEKAVALQNYFLNPRNFTYSLNGPTGNGFAPLVAFLTTHPQGYCQQFAAAMALMARVLKIPSRVATGFTTGVRVGTSAAFQVDNHDAHAWPELYFEGIGWLRFEPTPRGDSQTAPPAYGNLTVAEIKALGKSSSTGSTTITTPAARDPHQIGRGSTGAGKTGSGSSGLSLPFSGRTLGTIIAIVVLALIIVALPLLRSSSRRRRLRSTGDPRAVALLAWRETMRDAYDLGHISSVTDSPRQAARRLTDSAGLTGSAVVALDRLARAVERARYAPLAGDATGLLDAAAAVSVAMYATASRRTRLRARMFPPSTMARVGDGWSRSVAAVTKRTGQLMDRLNTGANRLLRRPSAPAADQVRQPEERPKVGVDR